MHYLDYNEKKDHGTQDFPLEFYHVDRDHPRYEMPFHWHRELEIIHILQGRFTAYLNEEMHAARAGDFLFIPPGAIHGGTPEDCVYECVVFDPDRLLGHIPACRRHLRTLLEGDAPIRAHFSAAGNGDGAHADRPFLDAAAALFDAARSGAPGHELDTAGALFSLFGVLFSHPEYREADRPPVRYAEHIRLLKPVLEYIEQYYMRPLTLDDLARLTGMSPRYFCRFFRTFIHRTPIDYLNYYRVERACQLLASSGTVTEAAYRCGFNDSSYFVKIFKKYKGITPKQYQKAEP